MLSIDDIDTADSVDSVKKTRIQWLEYYYNGLIDNTMGYSSTASSLIERFEEDYDVPTGANVSDYYPDAEHLINGKMVYWGDTENPNYQNPEYQHVGKFKKGFYKDAFSTANLEVFDRCIETAQAFFRKYFGLNHFSETHYHGSYYSNNAYKRIIDGNEYYFLDRYGKVSECGHGKFYMSRLGAFVTECDILSDYGMAFLKDSQYRTRANYIGEIGYYYGQREIKDSYSHFGGNFRMHNGFLAAFGAYNPQNPDDNPNGQKNMTYTDFMAFLDGEDDWFKYLYENQGVTNITKNGVTMQIYKTMPIILRDILKCRGTGKIPMISIDTLYNNPAMFLALELIFRFLKENGYEVVSYETARDKILSSDRNECGNLFPNPAFEQSLLRYLGGNSSIQAAYIPDGWYKRTGADDTSFTVTEKTLKIIGSITLKSDIYGLSSGKYKLTYTARTDNTATVNITQARNSTYKDSEELLYTDSITNEWLDYSHDIVISEPYRNIVDENNPISVICNGYEDNIVYISFEIIVPAESGGIKKSIEIKNINLIKNN